MNDEPRGVVMADEQTAPSPAQVFALRLFAQVCDGPRTLRDRLLAAGLDTLTIARVVGCSPRLLTRITHGGATPRGVLMRLAGLAVIADQLRANGVPVTAVGGPCDARSAEVINHLADQSDIAQRLINGLAIAHADGSPMQLSLAS